MMIRTKDNNIIKIIIERSNERIYVMCLNNLFFISIWYGYKLATYLASISIYFFRLSHTFLFSFLILFI